MCLELLWSRLARGSLSDQHQREALLFPRRRVQQGSPASLLLLSVLGTEMRRERGRPPRCEEGLPFQGERGEVSLGEAELQLLRWVRLLLSPSRKGPTLQREAAKEAALRPLESLEPGGRGSRGPGSPPLRPVDWEIFSLGSFCGLGLLFLQ